MNFVISWKIRPGNTTVAVERFLATGQTVPEGLQTVARWHRTDLQSGVHIVHVTNLGALARYAAQWTDLLELETSSVIADAEAIDAYRRIAGVKAQAARQGG